MRGLLARCVGWLFFAFRKCEKHLITGSQIPEDFLKDYWRVHVHIVVQQGHLASNLLGAVKRKSYTRNISHQKKKACLNTKHHNSWAQNVVHYHDLLEDYKYLALAHEFGVKEMYRLDLFSEI